MSGPRLSIIPAGAIFDRSLEPRDLHVLNLLGCHTDKAGWCRRSQVRMAQELDCSRSSVQRSLERLCDAGWVQKKRAPWGAQEGQPSNSYMYRVVLDRDDVPDATIRDSNDEPDTEPSHAQDATVEGECPPVGTPEQGEGAQPDGHPGAQPWVGTGAHTYVGTKNDPLERPPIERERDARARDRGARFLVSFEQRWPTAASDDRQRTAYAAESLSPEEQAAALTGIGPFLDDLKRHKRSTVPAGWKYLEQKRWTLLEAKQPGAATSTIFAAGSPEANAVRVLHDIAGRASAFRNIYRRPDGSVVYSKPLTVQLVAIGQAGDPGSWVTLTRNQAGAWENLLDQVFDPRMVRQRLREGSKAPWEWPPSVEGKIYVSTGPPGNDALMTEQDFADFKG